MVAVNSALNGINIIKIVPCGFQIDKGRKMDAFNIPVIPDCKISFSNNVFLVTALFKFNIY